MKVIAVSIAAAATLTLAACGSGARATAPPSTTARTTAPPRATARTTATTAPIGDPATDMASDQAAETSLRNALTAALTVYTDRGDFGAADVAGLTPVEPSLTFQSAASKADMEISVAPVVAGQRWWATALSRSGTCFGIEYDTPGAGAGADGGVMGVTFAGTRTVLAQCKAPATDPDWSDTSW